jgi:hypothetical protein
MPFAIQSSAKFRSSSRICRSCANPASRTHSLAKAKQSRRESDTTLSWVRTTGAWADLAVPMMAEPILSLFRCPSQCSNSRAGAHRATRLAHFGWQGVALEDLSKITAAHSSVTNAARGQSGRSSDFKTRRRLTPPFLIECIRCHGGYPTF